MGLIQVMKDLEDIKAVGHGIAVAFVATVYGVASANIFFLPVANKLRGRSRATALAKDLILEGVVGIVEGLNPTLLRTKLGAYNQDSPPAAKTKAAKSAGRQAADARPAPEGS
jgi:chemotaxis protein MotA